MQKKSSLRVLTYNIHKGIGGIDRSYRPERIVDVLKYYDADLVLLQEVDNGVPRSRHDCQVDLLGDALDYPHRCYYPNVRLKKGHYGNAILSRFPIDHHENINLTIPLKKRRSALHSRFSIHKTRFWVFNVHLGLARYERHRQLKRLVEWTHHHRLHHDTVVILGGDFNDVFGRLSRLLAPEHYSLMTPSFSTFPAKRPLRPLDRIFLRGPALFKQGHVGRIDLAKEASDHLPLIADIELL